MQKKLHIKKQAKRKSKKISQLRDTSEKIATTSQTKKVFQAGVCVYCERKKSHLAAAPTNSVL